MSIHPLLQRCLHRHPAIIFVHIPKTGGSSISAALRRHYRLSRWHVKSAASAQAARRRFGVPDDTAVTQEEVQSLRLMLVHYAAQCGRRYITGHFWADASVVALRSLGYRLITCLRDPVERWYSDYFYNRYKSEEHGRIDEEFETFLEGGEARAMGTTYVRYLGGIRADGDYTGRDARDTALANLAHYDAVGFLEDLPGFVRQLRGCTGLRLRMPHRRRSPATPALVERYRNSPVHRRAVEALCAPDIAIYREARQRFSGE